MKDINPILETAEVRGARSERNQKKASAGSEATNGDGAGEENSPKAPKIFKRFPLDKEVPVTIEYHFEERSRADNFKIPQKRKSNYDLLPETQERIRPVDNFRKTCPTSSFYRILQLKIDDDIKINVTPKKLYRCMYCGGDFSIVMRCEEGRFCSWNCYELFIKEKKPKNNEL